MTEKWTVQNALYYLEDLQSRNEFPQDDAGNRALDELRRVIDRGLGGTDLDIVTQMWGQDDMPWDGDYRLAEYDLIHEYLPEEPVTYISGINKHCPDDGQVRVIIDLGGGAVGEHKMPGILKGMLEGEQQEAWLDLGGTGRDVKQFFETVRSPFWHIAVSNNGVLRMGQGISAQNKLDSFKSGLAETLEHSEQARAVVGNLKGAQGLDLSTAEGRQALIDRIGNDPSNTPVRDEIMTAMHGQLKSLNAMEDEWRGHIDEASLVVLSGDADNMIVTVDSNGVRVEKPKMDLPDMNKDWCAAQGAQGADGLDPGAIQAPVVGGSGSANDAVRP